MTIRKWPKSSDTYKLVKYGKKTQALIYNKFIYDGHKYTEYHILYHYSVNDRVLYGNENVSQTDYEATHIGDRMTVTYLPETPFYHIEGTAEWEKFQYTLATIITVTIIFIIGMWIGIAITEGLANQRLELLKNGIATDAVVTDKRTIYGRYFISYYIKYEFHDGAKINMIEYIVIIYLYNSLHSGEYITILYDHAHSSVNQPYETIIDVRILYPTAP